MMRREQRQRADMAYADLERLQENIDFALLQTGAGKAIGVRIRALEQRTLQTSLSADGEDVQAGGCEAARISELERLLRVERCANSACICHSNVSPSGLCGLYNDAIAEIQAAWKVLGNATGPESLRLCETIEATLEYERAEKNNARARIAELEAKLPTCDGKTVPTMHEAVAMANAVAKAEAELDGYIEESAKLVQRLNSRIAALLAVVQQAPSPSAEPEHCGDEYDDARGALSYVFHRAEPPALPNVEKPVAWAFSDFRERLASQGSVEVWKMETKHSIIPLYLHPDPGATARITDELKADLDQKKAELLLLQVTRQAALESAEKRAGAAESQLASRPVAIPPEALGVIEAVKRFALKHAEWSRDDCEDDLPLVAGDEIDAMLAASSALEAGAFRYAKGFLFVNPDGKHLGGCWSETQPPNDMYRPVIVTWNAPAADKE